MAKRIITITGATGNVGGKIVESLLKKGHQVRAIARHPEHLAAAKAKGAEIAGGSVEDAAFVEKAFAGSEAVFLMIPPNNQAEIVRAYQNRVGTNYARAIEKAGIRYAVVLSSVGAQLSSKNGPIAGVHDLEQRLNQIEPLNAIYLRPGFFMENNLWNIGLIKQAGINGSPMKPDLAIPMIATQDIAAVAADYLDRLDFKGKTVRELLGQRNVTMQQVTQALGQAIGKADLKYVQFPYEEAEKALAGMGFSPSVAGAMLEMYRGFNENVIKETEKRSDKNTTRTAIEDFAREIFAKAYNN